jgi:phage baseplate assembly protein gpV
MRFFNPSVNFDGIIEMEGSITGANHVITKSFAEANLIAGIHSDSANYAELVTVGGVQQIRLKPLTITDVRVDTSAASLAAWISANYSAGTEYQEADVIILTGTGSTRPESYIHNGGSAGTAADWTKIQGADVQASEVRGFLSGGTGIDYNSGTGAISANQAAIRGFFSADAGGLLSYDSSNGVYNLTAATVQAQITASGLLSKSGGELSLASSDVRGLFSGGDNITYDSASGAISISNGRIRSRFSLESGALLSYDDSSGKFDLQASTIQNQITVAGGLLSKSAGEISLTSANVRGLLSATGLATYNSGTGAIDVASSAVRNVLSVDGSGLLSYDASAGQFNLTATTVQNQITVSGGILAKSAGEISLSAANVRSQISASSPGADTNLLAYNAGAGELSVLLSSFRKEFNNQSLSAGVFTTLNHGLGKKYVHVSAYDSSGNAVVLEVQATDTNNVKVKSHVNVSGLEIAVSI